MRWPIRWGPWLLLTTNQRARQAEHGQRRGHVVVWNTGDGGWQLNAYVDGVPSQAYVPGVVTWRAAERCASQYLRRLMMSEGVAA